MLARTVCLLLQRPAAFRAVDRRDLVGRARENVASAGERPLLFRVPGRRLAADILGVVSLELEGDHDPGPIRVAHPDNPGGGDDDACYVAQIRRAEALEPTGGPGTEIGCVGPEVMPAAGFLEA